MSGARRIGGEDSATRAALLDAAMHLMLDEGYAAVTTRRVATVAEANPALVHYYFRNVDGLFLALLRRGADAHAERLRRAAASPQPLRELWKVYTDRRGSALNNEFTALANHRKTIRAEIAEHGRRFREQEHGIVAAALADTPLGGHVDSAAITMALASMGRVMVLEQGLDIDTCHAEVNSVVDGYLSRLEAGAG